MGWLFAAAALIGGAVGLGLARSIGGQSDVPWSVVVSLLLWQPAVEELLFRGVLQGALLRTRFGARTILGLSLANVLASVAFVTSHLVHHAPLWALATFFPSLIFGVFRDRSGSVWPSLILHVWYNAAFFAPRFLRAW
jgi:membrane protease YdiL (CAAX protease family)